MTDPVCCDVSHWQGKIDFLKLAASGVLGVIAKATEKNTYKDDTYKRNRKDALDAGLAFASYHFLRPGAAMQAQADYYLAFADPDYGERVVCDWEDGGNPAADVQAFLTRIQNLRPDLQLTVYCSALFGPAQTKNAWLADNTSLWVARYTSGSLGPVPPSWKTWSLWQYSDVGKVPGITGNVDINRFNGSDDNFLAWMGPASDQPPAPPPAPPDVATITMDVRGDPGTILIVNGVQITL